VEKSSLGKDETGKDHPDQNERTLNYSLFAFLLRIIITRTHICMKKLFLLFKFTRDNDATDRGVVLYGMTIGRLPFLCPRDEWTSSEERRRRLMIQINRGLTSIQEKAMYQTSNECKNLINRLLVPSARERITIREILDHPWILASSKSNLHLCSEDDLNVSNHFMVYNMSKTL